MTAWSMVRLLVAVLAIVTAIFTATLGATLGGAGGPTEVTVFYVLAAVFALFSPAAIAVQVVLGQLLIGGLLLNPDPPAAWLLVLLLAVVVVTAELLALVARLDAPVRRDPADDLRRSAVAGVLGGSVFGAVGLVDGVPGPTGIGAVGLAAGICILVTSLVVRKAR